MKIVGACSSECLKEFKASETSCNEPKQRANPYRITTISWHLCWTHCKNLTISCNGISVERNSRSVSGSCRSRPQWDAVSTRHGPCASQVVRPSLRTNTNHDFSRTLSVCAEAIHGKIGQTAKHGNLATMKQWVSYWKKKYIYISFRGLHSRHFMLKISLTWMITNTNVCLWFEADNSWKKPHLSHAGARSAALPMAQCWQLCSFARCAPKQLPH